MFIPVGVLKEEHIYPCQSYVSVVGCLGMACQFVCSYWLCIVLLQHCIYSQTGQALQYCIAKIPVLSQLPSSMAGKLFPAPCRVLCYVLLLSDVL